MRDLDYRIKESILIVRFINTDGIFNRFVTVFANRARNLRGELS
jgi:hypothetical protein